MKRECGQSLVEFVVMTPLFFIILAGIIGIFYMQNRSYIDLEAKISLSMSALLFEQEERQKGHWQEGEADTLKAILDKSLNPSLAFKLAKDKNEGVFSDKSLLKYSEKNECHQKNTYSLAENGGGKFQLSTCADENGYEKRGYNFKNIFEGFSLSLFQSKGHSLYYPFFEMTWPERDKLASISAREFMFSTEGISFAKNYASLVIPMDASFFNHKCFMEPFLPACSLNPYSEKMDRAATDGANIQLTKCYIEMTIACSKTAIEYPACVGKGSAEITQAALTGFPSSSCPILNKAIEMYFKGIKAKAAYDAIANTTKEIDIRKNLL